jgi:hypothetical protein
VAFASGHQLVNVTEISNRLLLELLLEFLLDLLILVPIFVILFCGGDRGCLLWRNACFFLRFFPLVLLESRDLLVQGGDQVHHGHPISVFLQVLVEDRVDVVRVHHGREPAELLRGLKEVGEILQEGGEHEVLIPIQALQLDLDDFEGVREVGLHIPQLDVPIVIGGELVHELVKLILVLKVLLLHDGDRGRSQRVGSLILL